MLELVSKDRYLFTIWETHKMINSTALPKLTFNNAPSVSPSLCATLSVAKESIPAKGIIAMAFIAKMMVGFTFAKLHAIPTGTKTRRTLTQELRHIFFKVS